MKYKKNISNNVLDKYKFLKQFVIAIIATASASTLHAHEVIPIFKPVSSTQGFYPVPELKPKQQINTKNANIIKQDNISTNSTSKIAILQNITPQKKHPQPEDKIQNHNKSNKKIAKNSNYRPIIIIDPGHGGQDPGAVGKKGTLEKDINLDYSKYLAKTINSTGRYRAILTRDADVYIPLRKRINMARKYNGDMFISVHADSTTNSQARGVSVYTLSDRASDREAAKLAAHANRSDIIAGVNFQETDSSIKNMLIDLAQRDTNNKSVSLAETMVRELKKNVKILPNTHRQAGFVVLKSPDVPSVLVEVGFLSNSTDEKLLNRASYRNKVIDGIIDSIDAYFNEHGIPGKMHNFQRYVSNKKSSNS